MTFAENMLKSLIYEGALQMLAVLEEDADILSFDAVLESLQEALFARGAGSYRKAANVSVDETRAELTMVRIPTADDNMTFELLPPCTFYGKVSDAGNSGESIDGAGETVLIILRNCM